MHRRSIDRLRNIIGGTTRSVRARGVLFLGDRYLQALTARRPSAILLPAHGKKSSSARLLAKSRRKVESQRYRGLTARKVYSRARH